MQPASYKIKSRFKAIALVFLLILTACVEKQIVNKGDDPPKRIFPFEEFVIAEIQSNADIADLANEYLGDRSKSWIISEFNSIRNVTAGQKVVIPKEPFNLGGLESGGYQTVPVLVYHGFSKNKPITKWNVSEKAFEAQMKFLKKKKYHVISLNQLSDFCEYKAPIPSKAVVITINVGYQSFWKIAFPILKRYNFPFTIFIIPDWIKQKNTLSWAQLKTIAQQGGDVQSFTMSFRNFNENKNQASFRKYLKNVEYEIEQSKMEIEDKLGQKCQYLAYPDGVTNPLIIKLLKKHGYRAAFGSNSGGNPFFADRYRMRRSFIRSDYDLKLFEKELIVFKKKLIVSKSAELTLPKPDNLPDNINGAPEVPPEPSLVYLSKNYMHKAQELANNSYFTMALYYWKIAGRLDPANNEIRQATANLKKITRDEADKYYGKGKFFFNQNAFDKATDAFFAALIYNQRHEKALEDLTDLSKRKEYKYYKVKKGDKLKKIANKMYKNRNAAILIAFYNDLDAPIKLEEGDTLKIPDSQNIPIPTPQPPSPHSKKIKKALKLFEARRFEKAFTLAEEILEKDPSNTKTIDLKNAICLEWAKKLRDDKSLSRSSEILIKADPAYKGVDRLREEMEKELKQVYDQVRGLIKEINALVQAKQFENLMAITEKIVDIAIQNREAADLANTEFVKISQKLSAQNRFGYALELCNKIDDPSVREKAVNNVFTDIEERTKSSLNKLKNAIQSEKYDKKVLAVIDEIWEYAYLHPDPGLRESINRACLKRGREISAHGRYSLAIEMLKKVQTDSSVHDESEKAVLAATQNWLLDAKKLSNAGQFKKALTTTEQILKAGLLEKEAIELRNKIYLLWCQKLRREKKYDDALSKLNKADKNYAGVKKEKKKLAKIYFKLGDNAYINGTFEDLKKAEKASVICLKLEPDNINCKNLFTDAKNLIKKLIERFNENLIKIKKDLIKIKKCLKQDPDNKECKKDLKKRTKDLEKVQKNLQILKK